MGLYEDRKRKRSDTAVAIKQATQRQRAKRPDRVKLLKIRKVLSSHYMISRFKRAPSIRSIGLASLDTSVKEDSRQGSSNFLLVPNA